MPRKRKERFYEKFLGQEQAVAVDKQGAMEELRRRLIVAMSRQPDDAKALLQIANTLSRVVATEHRLAPGDRERLAESVVATLEGLGEQLAPGS